MEELLSREELMDIKNTIEETKSEHQRKQGELSQVQKAAKEAGYGSTLEELNAAAAKKQEQSTKIRKKREIKNAELLKKMEGLL